MPAARRASEAEVNSDAVQYVHEVFLTIQMNTTRLTGSLAFWARAAMSRRMGRVNVVPVEPEIRSTVSKEPKSLCELPYGPSINATCVSLTVFEGFESSLVGRRDVDEFVAVFRSRDVKPLCPLSKKTSSPP